MPAYKKPRGGFPESKVLSKWDRGSVVWACEQALAYWIERRRLAIANLDRRGIIRAKWNLRRATRLMERLRPSAKPCNRCGKWKPIDQFYFHAKAERHGARCDECCRELANMRYRSGLVYQRKQKEKLLQRGKELIQESRRQSGDAKIYP